MGAGFKCPLLIIFVLENRPSNARVWTACCNRSLFYWWTVESEICFWEHSDVSKTAVRHREGVDFYIKLLRNSKTLNFIIRSKTTSICIVITKLKRVVGEGRSRTCSLRLVAIKLSLSREGGINRAVVRHLMGPEWGRWSYKDDGVVLSVQAAVRYHSPSMFKCSYRRLITHRKVLLVSRW